MDKPVDNVANRHSVWMPPDEPLRAVWTTLEYSLCVEVQRLYGGACGNLKETSRSLRRRSERPRSPADEDLAHQPSIVKPEWSWRERGFHA